MIRFLNRMSGPLLAALLFIAVSPARAASGESAAGLALAEQWCASCHVVKGTQTQGQSDAPSFSLIVRRTLDPSPEWIAFTLLTPHPQMPQVSLSRAQAKQLSDYFYSLEKAQN